MIVPVLEQNLVKDKIRDYLKSPPLLSSPKIDNLFSCEILHSQSLFIYLLFKQSCWGYFGPQTTPTLQSIQVLVRFVYNHA